MCEGVYSVSILAADGEGMLSHSTEVVIALSETEASGFGVELWENIKDKYPVLRTMVVDRLDYDQLAYIAMRLEDADEE